MEISQNLLYFDIRQNKFAVKMQFIVEVVPMVEYSGDYSAVPIVRGKWLYRGKEIFVIDLKEFFGLEPLSEEALRERKSSNKENMLILNLRGQLIGLLVGQVYGVAAPKKVYPYPWIASTLDGRYFGGIAKIHDDLVIVLNEQNLMDDHELEVLKVS